MSQTSIFIQEPKDLYFADESDIMAVGSTDLTNAIEVEVSVNGSALATFSVDTYNGLAIIPIGEILRTSTERNRIDASEVTVRVSQNGVYASHTARCLFCRRLGQASSDLFSSWLTTGPSERHTYVGAAEILTFIADPEAMSQKAMIQILFADNSILTRQFEDLAGKTGDGIDVSHTAVRSFARSLQYYSDIVSYSIWIEHKDNTGNSRTGNPVKFIVSRDRVERITYKFVNPKGAWEYIHASGELSRSIESETGTFVTSGVETEVSNDSTKTMEQNSGHIGGAAEAEFWLGFLSSRERYVREADGTERLIVVDESNPSVTDLKVGELTFKWHYSNKNNTIINKISIPVESIEIVGESVVDNDRNESQFGIVYNPASTTQRGVVWQLVEGAAYASLSSTGQLTVKNGAQGNQVTIKAVSSHNGDILDTKTITVTYHAEAAPSYGLSVTSNVDSPSISLEIDGTAVEYFDGILIREGQNVTITVSKEGYSPVTRSFIFTYGEKDQYFQLSEDIPVTFAYPKFVSAAAQNVPIVVSDESGKGWGISFQMSQYYGYVTGGGVTSGNASVSGTQITGSGDAVVYLSLSANEETYSRTLGSTRNPIYIKLSESGSWEIGLSFSQLGTSSQQVAVTGVTLNKNTMSLSVGGSDTLIASVSPSNATNKAIAWSSSNTSVATVSQDGKVTAKAPGQAMITAMATDGSGRSAQCAVTVTSASVAVTGVTVNKSELSLKEGGTTKLSANVSPSNATNKSVTWSSSNPSVATVTQDGTVAALSEGTATITVTTADGGFAAHCLVTVSPADPGDDPGSMSAEDLSVAAAQTSASVVIDCENMDISSLSASSVSSWLTGVAVDTSGTYPRVRLSFEANNSTTARTAVVTISGSDNNGDIISTEFTLSQKGWSSSDIPCTGMTINGADSIENTANEAEYSVSFLPSATTQRGVIWSVTGPATIIPNGLSCVVRLTTSADESDVVLTATNSYNGNILASKTILGTYIHDSGSISVSPGAVTVPPNITSDNTPEVSASGISEGSLTVWAVSGFIDSAEIRNGRLVASFTMNSSTTSTRSGSVTLRALDLNGDIVSAVVQYTQAAMPTPDYGFGVLALAITQIGGKQRCDFQVRYGNRSRNEVTVTGLTYTLEILNGQGTPRVTRTGPLADKTIAALSQEEEVYSATYSASTEGGDTYRITLSSGTLSSTYTGDGTDEIDI